jgi:hypothetical protein
MPFPYSCTNLHSHVHWIRVPFPCLNPHQHLLFLLLMRAVLTEVRWNLNAMLTCISFMVQELSISSCVYWAFCISLFETGLFSSFAPLLMGC